jgi:hypothetical protein
MAAVLLDVARRHVIRWGLAGVFVNAVASCGLIMGDLPPRNQSSSQAAGAAGSTRDASLDAGQGTGGSGQPPDPTGDAGPDTGTDAAPPVDGGEPDADAMPPIDASLRCDGALPTLYYRDGDGDGYGDPDTATAACVIPDVGAWVENDDDCADGERDVHPEQTEYFDVGYRSEANLTGTSFDYNCDGSEAGMPGQTEARDCAGLLLCGGIGFEKNSARADVPGINAYCGSNVISECVGSGLLCQSFATTSDMWYLCN